MALTAGVSLVGLRNVVARPRLYDLLDRAVANRLTVVSAPAGSGKTVLLRAWLERPNDAKRGRVAWVAVEREEKDQQRFWLSVISALNAAMGGGPLASTVSPSLNFDGARAVERLLSDLAGVDEGVVLVIDDLHELNSPEILAQLELLLRRMPPTLHVVLSTRRDPQLGLGRLRLSGELRELRVADLKFSLDEARQLLEGSAVVLSEPNLAVLHERTEGWAAGLRLAAIALEGHPEPFRLVAEFSGSERTVADYLLEEMLDRQPAEVRNLLLCTSVLERVTGPLADYLTGRSGAQRILQALEEDNAFVVSLDAGRAWFRYHHLFADLLRLELRRTQPDRVADLHWAAAAWLAGHGYVIDAVKHAQASGDWQGAASMLAEHMVSLLLNGEGDRMRDLLGVFPQDAATKNPELAMVLAADQMLRGSLEDATAYLDLAESRAATVPPERRGRFERTVLAGRLSVARRRGDCAAALEQVQATPRLEAHRSADIGLWNDLQGVALMNLGIAELWSGHLDDAQAHLEEGVELARRIGRPYIEMGCLAHLGPLGYLRSLPTAWQRCEEAIAIADSHGWGSEPFVVVALVGLAGMETWRGRFDEADQWLQRALAALHPDAEPVTALLLRFGTGLLYLARGRPDLARREFDAAERFSARITAPAALLAQMRGLNIQTQARMGEAGTARAGLAAMSDLDRRWGESRIALAAVELAEDRPAAAVDALVPVLDRSAPVVHVASLVQALLFDALANRGLGDGHSAAADVERALDLAEPHGLVLPFALCRAQDLLVQHHQHRTGHGALLADILDVLNGLDRAHQRGPVAAFEELSEGELRVLRYLPGNLTAPEIGAQLYLSLNTVKTHLRNIYAKLGVHRRSEAVQRARELGLVAPSGRRR